jgi:hypothetical protein
MCYSNLAITAFYGQWRIFLAKHAAAKCNYEIYDKKLLAIIKCLKEWRPKFQGTAKPFKILINYKNLKYFTTTKALNQR